MKKIAFLLPSLRFGGIESNTIRLANNLAAKGFEIDLLLGKADGEYLNRISDKVNIVDFNKDKMYLSLFQLTKYVNTNQPNAIISGGEAPNIVLLMSKLLSKKKKTRFIVSIRTQLSIELKNTKRINPKILKILGKVLYKYADSVVAVSKGVAEDVSNLFNLNLDQIKVIYNPIIDDSIENKLTEKIDHPWYNDKKHPIVLAAGRLARAKNFTLLIESFDRVLDNIDAKLIILGDGPEKELLNKQINQLGLNQHVDLLGYESNPYKYMKNSDLFVLSSDWEGFGNVIVEALATGLKVVSTDCKSGPSEILENGKFGYLVKPGDSNALAKAIIFELYNNRKIALNIERSKEFTVDKAAEEYVSLIE